MANCFGGLLKRFSHLATDTEPAESEVLKAYKAWIGAHMFICSRGSRTGASVQGVRNSIQALKEGNGRRVKEEVEAVRRKMCRLGRGDGECMRREARSGGV